MQIFISDKAVFQAADNELAAYNGAVLELPVTFEPSYAYSENVKEPNVFLSKRCVCCLCFAGFVILFMTDRLASIDELNLHCTLTHTCISAARHGVTACS